MPPQSILLAADYRARRRPAIVPPPPPPISRFFLKSPARLNYFAALPPLADNPLLELRRPSNKDVCFAISALSPQICSPVKDSVGTCLLDRYLYAQGYEPSVAEKVPRAVTYTTRKLSLEPLVQDEDQLSPVLDKSNGWTYVQTPLTPRNPRNIWAFMSHPPATENELCHQLNNKQSPEGESIFEEFEGPSATTKLPEPGFEQLYTNTGTFLVQDHANSAPLSVMETPISDSPVSTTHNGHGGLSSFQPAPSTTTSDVGLAREKAARKLEGLSSPAMTGSTKHDVGSRTSLVSSGRGMRLSPLITSVDGSGQHTKAGAINSAVMTPSFSESRSPLSLSRGATTSTPPVWSPLTPLAMSMEMPVLVNSDTPPLPSIAWYERNLRHTVIDEHPQEEPPWELAAPQGQQFAESLNNKPTPQAYKGGSCFSPFDTPISPGGRQNTRPVLRIEPISRSRSRPRARSMSPTRSAHPDESPLHWNRADKYNPHATDDNLDIKSPLVAPPQMLESFEFAPEEELIPKSRRRSKKGNSRDTILGSYFQGASMI